MFVVFGVGVVVIEIDSLSYKSERKQLVMPEEDSEQ